MFNVSNLCMTSEADRVPIYDCHIETDERDKMEILMNMDSNPFYHIKKEETYSTKLPEIKNVIYNEPATIVFWKDNTKTVVKCDHDYEEFDKEKGLAMAIIKKMNCNKGNYNEVFKKWAWN